MCCISRQLTHVLFKCYISKLGGRVKTCADPADKGAEGVQNLGKPADVILERSIILKYKELPSPSP